MFEYIKLYKDMIIAGITILFMVVFVFYIYNLKSQITSLKSDLQNNVVKLANSKLQSERYKNSLDIQSKEIKALKVSKSNALKELGKWKAKPAKVKYKVIEKIREVKSNECKDIKNTLDAIRKLDYSNL